jgi:hypothetical protein
VAITLKLHRNGAVGFIDWLGLCASLVDKAIIIWALAIKRLSSAARTSLRVASEDVQLAFRDAAIMTRPPICSPVFLLGAIANTLIFFAANPKGSRNRTLAHGDYRPNETEISHGRVRWQTLWTFSKWGRWLHRLVRHFGVARRSARHSEKDRPKERHQAARSQCMVISIRCLGQREMAPERR